MSFESRLLQRLRQDYVQDLEVKTKLDEAENFINDCVEQFEENIEEFIPVSRGEIEIDYRLNDEEFFAEMVIKENKLVFKRNIESIEIYTRARGEVEFYKIDELIAPSSSEACISVSGGYLNDYKFDQYLERAFAEVLN
ncbi:hypothetical protein [Bacillus badius]|uniref:Uncharacterized protein n=1 Tax=Bacillus badius TaxID=1455 RepID=A0ABR5ANT5_BACBA|nr:hypothetical protein [Bacillus badius]KIL72700.1 hypothetical protein SD77_3435 [Bacillus badius]MED4715453.1 hypothetical protein [Bacillus badius]